MIVVDNYLFRKNRGNYWRCIRCTKYRCKSRLILKTENDEPIVIGDHTHGPEREKIEWGRKVKTTVKEKDNLFEEPVQLYSRQPHFDTESLIVEDQ